MGTKLAPDYTEVHNRYNRAYEALLSTTTNLSAVRLGALATLVDVYEAMEAIAAYGEYRQALFNGMDHEGLKPYLNRVSAVEDALMEHYKI